MQIKIDSQKVSRYFKSTVSAGLHGIVSPEISINWKNQFPCSQKHYFQTLQPAYGENISKFNKWPWPQVDQPIASVTNENEKISIKKQITLHKLSVTSLL